MLLILTIMAREFLMPWLPMPLSRKPWNCKNQHKASVAFPSRLNAKICINASRKAWAQLEIGGKSKRNWVVIGTASRRAVDLQHSTRASQKMLTGALTCNSPLPAQTVRRDWLCTTLVHRCSGPESWGCIYTVLLPTADPHSCPSVTSSPSHTRMHGCKAVI